MSSRNRPHEYQPIEVVLARAGIRPAPPDEPWAEGMAYAGKGLEVVLRDLRGSDGREGDQLYVSVAAVPAKGRTIYGTPAVWNAAAGHGWCDEGFDDVEEAARVLGRVIPNIIRFVAGKNARELEAARDVGRGRRPNL